MNKSITIEKENFTKNKVRTKILIYSLLHKPWRPTSYSGKKRNIAKLTHYQTTNFRLFQTERVCI